MSERARRGEVSLTIDGRTYTLALDINAMVILEERHDEPFADVLAKLLKPSGSGNYRVAGIREVVWAALQSHHPGTTEEEAGRLLTAAGGLDGFAKVLSGITGDTVPDARDVKELSEGASRKSRPRRAQDEPNGGTGERSTSTLARSA